MKKIFLLLFLAMTFIFTPTKSFGASYTKVYIDSNEVKFNLASGYPFVENSRTYVPLRATMEAFGAIVSWEATEGYAVIQKDMTTVICPVGENFIYRNGTKIINDAKTVIRNQRTYLPIRVVCEAFGATVEWDGSVKIFTGQNSELIKKIEKTPSVTDNYWNIYNAGVSMESKGDYSGALLKYLSISKVFIEDNDNRNRAIFYRHLSDCFANTGDFVSSRGCIGREIYYWEKTNGMEECLADAMRRYSLLKTEAKVYVKTTDKNMSSGKYFGEMFEPGSGICLGAYAEGDHRIYDSYNPNKFYMDTFPKLVGKDMAAYLLYLPYGTDISHYQTHIDKAVSKDKIMQIALEPSDGMDMVKPNDKYLINLAKEMNAGDCLFMLRFAGEMNDPTNPWYEENPDVFIEKFRMVADVFKKYAPKVPIIWAPNFWPTDNIDDYYPGDDYVDYVGISSYMTEQRETDPFGEGIDRGRWSSQLDNIYSLYGYKKPIIVVEGGASYINYDTGEDITDYASYQLKDFYTYLPIKYPNVKMCFIFGGDVYRRKFSLSGNEEYLNAYKASTDSPLYHSNTYNKNFRYSYYELCNGATVKAEKTTLASYISVPKNDVAYVIYYINGNKLPVLYDIPYEQEADFSRYKGKSVDIRVSAYDSSHKLVADYSYKVNVV